MARELDEAWVEEAITRYRRIEQLQAELDTRIAKTEVTVHSPDQLVEVVVCADGTIRKVNVAGSLTAHTNEELSRSIEAAIAAAGDAAQWARRTLHAEVFAGYPPVGTA